MHRARVDQVGVGDEGAEHQHVVPHVDAAQLVEPPDVEEARGRMRPEVERDVHVGRPRDRSERLVTQDLEGVVDRFGAAEMKGGEWSLHVSRR